MPKRIAWLFTLYFAWSVSMMQAKDLNPNFVIINQFDSIIFDLSQSVCSSGQVNFPVYFISDDPIYAVDFSLKFNPNGFTFNSVTNIQAGLSTSAFYNSSDSTLRFTSYSIAPMVSNSPLVSLRFNLPSANISLAMFDSVYTLLNGDDCSKRFINPLIPAGVGLIGSPVINPGDCSTLFINTQPGLNYLWSTGQTTSQITVCLPGTYSVTVSAVQGCNAVSHFTLLAPSPLPVELLYFKGKSYESMIHLEWATASEIDNDYFTVERMDKFGDRITLGIIPGSGTAIIESRYAFNDYSPAAGINIYRLVQTDYDGDMEVFSEIAVNHRSARRELSVFPNPFIQGKHSVLTVEGSCPGDVQSTTLYDSQGIVICSVPRKNSTCDTEMFKTELELNRQLSPGIYHLKIQTSREMISTRVIVIN